MENEKQKEAFVGKKYESVYNCKYSIFTFLFGPYYWAYRKMLIPSVLLVLVNTILALVSFMVFKGLAGIAVFTIASLIIQGIAGALFGSLYRNYVDKTVQKLIESDVSDSEFEEVELCKKRGGTSFVYALVIIVLFSLIFSGLASVLLKDQIAIYDPKDNPNNENQNVVVNETNTNTVEDDENTVTNTDTNTSTRTDDSGDLISIEEKKDGSVRYNIITNTIIKKYIDIEFPDDLEKEYNDAYAYEYYQGEIGDKDITVLVAIIDAKDAKSFIADVAKKNDVSGNEYSFENNNITWHLVGYETRKKIVYYNAFDHESGRVILYRYEIKKDFDDSSFLSIFYSINQKEVEKDEQLEIIEDDNKVRKIDNTTNIITNSSKNESKNNTNTNTNTTDDDEYDDEEEDDNDNETNTSNSSSKRSNSITINSVSNTTTEDE